MNYFNPNYYNYPYNVGNNQYMPTSYAMPSAQAPAAALNGKIVDSEDVVKVTEVPIGGYGIFPKADLSEIYVKTWNNNGTTSLITFKPFIPPEPSPKASENFDTETILEKITALDNKLDALLNSRSTISKEGLKANEY